MLNILKKQAGLKDALINLIYEKSLESGQVQRKRFLSITSISFSFNEFIEDNILNGRYCCIDQVS